MPIKQILDDTLVLVVEVYARKPCEAERKLASGVLVIRLDICGVSRTCRPCIARSFVKEAESLYI